MPQLIYIARIVHRNWRTRYIQGDHNPSLVDSCISNKKKTRVIFIYINICIYVPRAITELSLLHIFIAY